MVRLQGQGCVSSLGKKTKRDWPPVLTNPRRFCLQGQMPVLHTAQRTHAAPCSPCAEETVPGVRGSLLLRVSRAGAAAVCRRDGSHPELRPAKTPLCAAPGDTSPPCERAFSPPSGSEGAVLLAMASLFSPIKISLLLFSNTSPHLRNLE